MNSLKRFAAACLVIVLGFIAQPAFAVAHKITFSDGAPELELGASTTITLSLDQPIICPSQVNCEVVVDFGGALPQGLSVTPSSVTWSSAEWSQQRAITVAVDADAESLAGKTTAIEATVTSASEYYSGFAPSFEVTLPEAAVPPVMYDKRTLSNTGSNDLAHIGAGMLLVASGLLIRRGSHK